MAEMERFACIFRRAAGTLRTRALPVRKIKVSDSVRTVGCTRPRRVRWHIRISPHHFFKNESHPGGVAFIFGGDGEIRPARAPRRHALGHRNMPPACFSRCARALFESLQPFMKYIPHQTVGDMFHGGDGEIRTLEELLTPTRFPIVRARPTTRHLHVNAQVSPVDLSARLL